MMPAPKPAIRMLVPPRWASHASTNSTSSDRRRSSAQRRCLERARTRWTHRGCRRQRAASSSSTAAPRDQRGPEQRVRRARRLQHDRDRDDRDHVGDRHLRHHGQRQSALHAGLLERREQHRG